MIGVFTNLQIQVKRILFTHSTPKKNHEDMMNLNNHVIDIIIKEVERFEVFQIVGQQTC